MFYKGRGGGGARFDECIDDSGSWRFNLVCFTMLEAVGGSFVRVLRVGEALGGSDV